MSKASDQARILEGMLIATKFISKADYVQARILQSENSIRDSYSRYKTILYNC